MTRDLAIVCGYLRLQAIDEKTNPTSLEGGLLLVCPGEAPAMKWNLLNSQGTN